MSSSYYVINEAVVSYVASPGMLYDAQSIGGLVLYRKAREQAASGCKGFPTMEGGSGFDASQHGKPCILDDHCRDRAVLQVLCKTRSAAQEWHGELMHVTAYTSTDGSGEMRGVIQQQWLVRSEGGVRCPNSNRHLSLLCMVRNLEC